MFQSKLLKAGSLYFIGNIFDKALAFITVPIFTKLLSTNDYGIASTYLSWVGILTVVITLSLGNSIRTAFVDFPKSLDGFISSIFTLGTISASVVTCLVLLVCQLFGFCDLKLALCCCVQSFMASILVTIQWKYMMHVDYLKRTLLQCLPNLLIVVLSILLIMYMPFEKYWGKIIAYVLIYAIFGITLLLIYLKKGRTFVNLKYWNYALAFSLPIIFHSLSTVILSQADRTMITLFRNSSETGLYSLAYQFGLIPLVAATTLENIWIPWFTSKMKDQDYAVINNTVRIYINSLVCFCAIIMLVSPDILYLMTDPSYHSASVMVSPIILSTFFMFLASIPLDLEYYLKKTQTIALNTTCAAVFNIILNFLFVPRYGAVAAAYTTLASYVLSFVMHYVFARKLGKQLFSFRIYVLPIIATSFISFFSIFYIDNLMVRLLLCAVVGVVFIIYIYMRKEFLLLLRK